MNIYDATENAYRNGYEKAKQDVAKEIFAELETKAPWFCENQTAYEHFNEELDQLKKKYIRQAAALEALRSGDDVTKKMKNKYTQEFLRLVAENPTLPVCAMVDSDVVCDDGGWWMGQFGAARVGEIAVYDELTFDDRESFKERYYDNHDDELCEKFQYKPWVNAFALGRGECTAEQVALNNEFGKAMDQYLDEIANKFFVKAIIVYVETPDDFITEL